MFTSAFIRVESFVIIFQVNADLTVSWLSESKGELTMCMLFYKRNSVSTMLVGKYITVVHILLVYTNAKLAITICTEVFNQFM